MNLTLGQLTLIARLLGHHSTGFDNQLERVSWKLADYLDEVSPGWDEGPLNVVLVDDVNKPEHYGDRVMFRVPMENK